MDPVVSDPQPREARMLAAIVFTDVVGFSKLASQNEGRVYVALQRDMGVMTNLCRAHGGQVLNTMGDGMLLCFASAVDAMSCATEIQQTLYNQALTLPAGEVLHHRIGVHLGDVIMSGDNVFGDGVNVAARLQALAKPGAVCFSSTVYEIVKNKLKIDDAKYLGPRQLKNLGEPVRVWQVPPIGDGQARIAVTNDDPAPLIAPEAPQGVKGFKGLILLLASVVLVGGLGFAFTKLKPIDHVLPPVTDRDIRKAKEGHKKDPPTEVGNPSVVAAAPDAGTIRTAVENDIRAYEFEKAANEIVQYETVVPDLKDKVARLQELAAASAFVSEQLRKTNTSTTVAVTLADGQVGHVYLSGQQLYFVNSVDTRSTNWPPDPQVYRAILEALLARTVDGSTAPAGSSSWVQLFSSEFPPVVAPSGS